jgi:hypothetical protein
VFLLKEFRKHPLFMVGRVVLVHIQAKSFEESAESLGFSRSVTKGCPF